MKIEKINDNQIKCTLNKSDLASRQIKLSELAYRTEKAKSLFRDMMQQASAEFGFEAEDIPLMIEAIPVSSDCIILVITKVEDPEELDTRFSRFAPSDEEIDDMDVIEGDEFPPITNDLIDMLNQVKEKVAAAAGGTFTPLSEAMGIKKNDDKKSEAKVEKPMLKIFSFDNINLIIDVSKVLNGVYKGQNTLYKNPKDGRYYLVAHQSGHTLEEFSAVCCVLSEYGRGENSALANEAYMKEHFKKVIAKKAIQNLEKVGGANNEHN